jgi:hypothetical protein
VGHGFEDYYRNTAERMVAVMANAIATERGNYDQKEWAVPVNSRHVLLTPDRLLCDPAGVVHVQRIRTGRMSKSEPDHPIYALLRRGAAAYHPGARIAVETFYLATGKVVPVLAKNDGKLIKQYADAIAGIERGDFPANPKDARSCPNCQCYFLCGM